MIGHRYNWCKRPQWLWRGSTAAQRARGRPHTSLKASNRVRHSSRGAEFVFKWDNSQIFTTSHSSHEEAKSDWGVLREPSRTENDRIRDFHSKSARASNSESESGWSYRRAPAILFNSTKTTASTIRKRNSWKNALSSWSGTTDQRCKRTFGFWSRKKKVLVFF